MKASRAVVLVAIAHTCAFTHHARAQSTFPPSHAQSNPTTQTWRGWFAVELLRNSTFTIENHTNREIVLRGSLPNSPRTIVPVGKTAARPAIHGAGHDVSYVGTRVMPTDDPSPAIPIEHMNYERKPRVVVEVGQGDPIVRSVPRTELTDRPTYGTFTIERPARETGAITRVTNNFWIRNNTGEWLAGHLLVSDADKRPLRAYRIDLDPDHDITLRPLNIEPGHLLSYTCVQFDASLPDRRIGMPDEHEWAYDDLKGRRLQHANTDATYRMTLDLTHPSSGYAIGRRALIYRPNPEWLPIEHDLEWRGTLTANTTIDGIIVLENHTNQPLHVAIMNDTGWSLTPYTDAKPLPPGEPLALRTAGNMAHVLFWPSSGKEPISPLLMMSSFDTVLTIEAGQVTQNAPRHHEIPTNGRASD